MKTSTKIFTALFGSSAARSFGVGSSAARAMAPRLFGVAVALVVGVLSVASPASAQVRVDISGVAGETVTTVTFSGSATTARATRFRTTSVTGAFQSDDGATFRA